MINVETIATNLGYSKTNYDDNICSYIINCEIEKRIRSANDSKRFKHIVYITAEVKPNVISNMRHFIFENGLHFDGIILIDQYFAQREIYKHFDQVLQLDQKKIQLG